MSLPDDTYKQVFMSLENPLFPKLISAQTAEHLLYDFATNSGSTIEDGQGVYKGVAEKCVRISIKNDCGERAGDMYTAILCMIARWAGQESILVVRRSYAMEVLKVETALQLMKDPNIALGDIMVVQNTVMEKEMEPAQIWKEVTRDDIYVDGAPKDHTVIGDKYFTLSAE